MTSQDTTLENQNSNTPPEYTLQEKLILAWLEFGLPILLGTASYIFVKEGLVKKIAPTLGRLTDPLIMAMVLGIIIRAVTGHMDFWKLKYRAGRKIMPAVAVLIPIGISFYALKNMNLNSLYNNINKDNNTIFLALLVVAVYFSVIYFLGKLLKQKIQIIYLTMTGSSICGASAIALTSPAVEAEPDDISISLLSVALTALIGLFIVMPFISILMGFSYDVFARFAGTILQFTGFVKMSLAKGSMFEVFLPPASNVKAANDLGVAIKALRFPVLVLAIPVFGLLIKRSFRLPIALWLFIISSVAGFFIATYTDFFKLKPWEYMKCLVSGSDIAGCYDANMAVKNARGKLQGFHMLKFISKVYGYSWSIALAAIGLNADIKQLMSFNGIKALIMTFVGFMAAVIAYIIGYNLLY